MAKVLVQKSHDVRFTEVITALEGAAFEPVVIADPQLGEAIEIYRPEITGFALFHLTEPASRAAALLLDERFGAPTTPMIYLGPFVPETHLPYGVSFVEDVSTLELRAFLARPRIIPVLVVEDDDGVRDVLQLSLSKHFAVDVAEDGAEALRRIREVAYDVVVLDVMLPVISGDEVFRHLRESSPDTAVLVITAHDTEKRELDYMFGGADGYLAKPFDSNRAFRQQVVEALRRHHDRAAASMQPRRAEEADGAWETWRRRMRAHV